MAYIDIRILYRPLMLHYRPDYNKNPWKTEDLVPDREKENTGELLGEEGVRVRPAREMYDLLHENRKIGIKRHIIGWNSNIILLWNGNS